MAAPYLTLMTEEAPQRDYPLREVFNGLRWIVRTGAPWRMMPNDLPPWYAVRDQSRRWLNAGVFKCMVHDLRQLLRLAEGRNPEPSAAIPDGRTLQSMPESGAWAGYDGANRKNGNKVHLLANTLGHLLALRVAATNEQDRAQVGALTERERQVTGETVELVYVDQNYTGEQPARDAAAQGIQLHVVKLPEAKKGFVLLPRRWVIERSFAWAARFRRLARDCERLPQTLAGLHFVAFAVLMLARFICLIIESA